MKPDPEKYWAPTSAWNRAEEAHRDILRQFTNEAIDWRDDKTRKDCTVEFFERIAEQYGFKITWPIRET